MRIAIVGGGIAGAALACALGSRHRVTCFERDAADRPPGAGLLLHPGGLQALQRLGLLEQAQRFGARIDAIETYACDGRTILDLRYARWQPGTFGLGLQRGALLALLRNAAARDATFHYQQPVDALDAQRGLLCTADGAWSGPFDLIVAADGRNAASRRAVADPPAQRDYCWSARLCLLDDPHGRYGGRLVQRYRGDAQVAVWPVGTAHAGAVPRINLSWRTSDAEQRVPFDIDQWRAQVAAVDPELAAMTRPLSPADVVDARYGALASACWGDGRLLLIGDAAHALSPQLGYGASLALQDACALADCIDGIADADAIRRRFVAQRDAHVARYRRLSRVLTPLFQSTHSAMRWLRERAVPRLARLPAVERAMLRTLARGDGIRTRER